MTEKFLFFYYPLCYRRFGFFYSGSGVKKGPCEQWAARTLTVILHIYQVENWDVLLNLHLYFMS